MMYLFIMMFPGEQFLNLGTQALFLVFNLMFKLLVNNDLLLQFGLLNNWLLDLSGTDDRLLKMLLLHRLGLSVMDHILMLLMDDLLVFCVNNFLLLWMDDWLNNVMNMLLVNDRLMMFMYNRLMMLMQNVFMSLCDDIFMMLMYNILMVFLCDRFIVMCLNNGCLFM